MLALVVGLMMLSLGGEALIRGALGMARRFRVSPLLCGIVIVGFGTSAPELAVSVDAILANNAEIALGNVVGSNIGNILLILSLCALISPLYVKIDALERDLKVLFVSTFACCILVSTEYLNLWSGIMLILGLFGYVIRVYQKEKSVQSASATMHTTESALVEPATNSVVMLTLMVTAGLALLILGSNLFLQGAISMATQLGMTSAMLGLSLVAIGTSLPELTISVLAVLRKQNDVAVGNVLGSNIFNVLGILGVSAIIEPIAVSSRMFNFDQWVLAGSVVALILTLRIWKKITRLAAAIAMGSYISYLWIGMVYFNV